MWSQHEEDAGNAFRRNTVIAPSLANGIAIYGGRDIAISDNLVADTLTQGGGLHLGTRFGATPLAGTINLSGNLVVRGGSMDPNWHIGVGALWFYALDHPITGARIVVHDTRLIDSSYEAVQFHGKAIEGVTIDGLRIDGASSAFRLDAPGEARVSGVVAEGLRGADDGATFQLIDGGGNRGWPLP
jgi:hypothetical protein